VHCELRRQKARRPTPGTKTCPWGDTGPGAPGPSEKMRRMSHPAVGLAMRICAVGEWAQDKLGQQEEVGSHARIALLFCRYPQVQFFAQFCEGAAGDPHACAGRRGWGEFCSTPLRVAIVGLEHGHVEGFLKALPGTRMCNWWDCRRGPGAACEIPEEIFAAETLLFKSEANMIEVRRPQAVLVYTPISEHRHAIEIAAQYGVSAMVEKPLTISLEMRWRSGGRRATTISMCW